MARLKRRRGGRTRGRRPSLSLSKIALESLPFSPAGALSSSAARAATMRCCVRRATGAAAARCWPAAAARAVALLRTNIIVLSFFCSLCSLFFGASVCVGERARRAREPVYCSCFGKGCGDRKGVRLERGGGRVGGRGGGGALLPPSSWRAAAARWRGGRRRAGGGGRRRRNVKASLSLSLSFLSTKAN